jgi:hypothetical protein
MRLTVHVEGAKKATTMKNTPEGQVKVRHTITTLSFRDVHPDEVQGILAQVKEEGHGTPVKHYLSGEKIPGMARIRKKK